MTKLKKLLKEKFLLFFLTCNCDTVSFLLNIISHAVHANEQTVLVLLTLDVFITVSQELSSSPYCIGHHEYHVQFFFLSLMAIRVTLSGLHFQSNVSTLQHTKHLREVPLTAFGYVLKALYYYCPAYYWQGLHLMKNSFTKQ